MSQVECRTPENALDDFISRDAVKNIIREMYVDRPLDSDRFVIRDFDIRVSKLPTVKFGMDSCRIYYLCDGEQQCNKSETCYKNGGECKHTDHFYHSKTGIPMRGIFSDRFVRKEGRFMTFYCEKEQCEPSEEIVRCKDCKYNPRIPRKHTDDDQILSFGWCYYMAGKDGFCCEGRKDADAE